MNVVDKAKEHEQHAVLLSNNMATRCKYALIYSYTLVHAESMCRIIFQMVTGRELILINHHIMKVDSGRKARAMHLIH